MSDSYKPLYVRLPSADAERLDALVAATGKSKRQLVTEAVRGQADDEGLTVGRIARLTELAVGRNDVREPTNQVMTLAEVALFLKLDKPAVQAIAKSGELPGRLIGDEWRFSRAAVLRWLGGDSV